MLSRINSIYWRNLIYSALIHYILVVSLDSMVYWNSQWILEHLPSNYSKNHYPKSMHIRQLLLMVLYISILGAAQSMSLFFLSIVPVACHITISMACGVNKPVTPQKCKYSANDNSVSYRYNLKRKFSLKPIVSSR